jgi:hypothetical protein
MFTTNMAFPSFAATYVQRRREAEKLTKIDRKMENLALRQPTFADGPVFQKLAVQRDAQLQRVLSLSAPVW